MPSIRSRTHPTEHAPPDVRLFVIALGCVFAAGLLYIALVNTWGMPADVAWNEWMF
jgi:hypothetical protein